MSESTYTIPCGPDAPAWCQALAQLGRRCEEYADAGYQTDAQLAALINELNAALVTDPKGRPVGLFGREVH